MESQNPGRSCQAVGFLASHLLLLLPDTGAGRQPSPSLIARRGLGGMALLSGLPKGLFKASRGQENSSPPSCLLICQRPCRKAFSYCSRGSHIAQLVKNLPTMQESPSLIPGLGRSTGEGTGCPLQCSGLENSADCTVHGVTKSQTRPRDFHFTFMGFSDHLTCLLRNLYFSGNQVRKQQLELDMEQQTGSKLGKKYVKSVYCHPAYLIYAEYIM